MATYNFTESGNYIYVAKSGDDGNYNGAKVDVRAFITGNVTPKQVRVSGMLAMPQTGLQNNGILLSECQIAGVTATEGTMQTFIDTHTGGKPSAGDSALTKVLAVFATQSGSDAPTFTYAKNDLGAVPALSYVDVGRFHITKTGAFTEGKTSEFCTLLAIDSNPVCKGFRVSDDVYEIQTGMYGSDLTDSLLNNSFIKIEIFN